jgi:hypothetical protein
MASMPHHKTDAEMASEARQKTARELFEKATNPDTPPPSRKQFWGELWRFVKTCKKSWPALGFNSREIERAKLNKPDWI